MQGESKFGTGDINFACALMAIGVPLSESKPCSLIAHENGNTYSRYHFESLSFDGRFDTVEMSRAWSDINRIPEAHPLSVISDFVHQSRHGMTISDWWELAHQVFDIGHVTNDSTALDHIRAFPENPESYIIAFILNRSELYALHTKAVQEVFMSNGKASTMIDVRLPKIQKQELINRLNG